MKKHFYGTGVVLILTVLACTFKQKNKPLDEKILPGKYCHNFDSRDSIFIYPDKTYKHTYHRTDGSVYIQTNTWLYKPDVNDVFFESFLFYNDGQDVDTANYNGSWSSSVFLTEEGQIKLRYSESVYYVKVPEK